MHVAVQQDVRVQRDIGFGERGPDVFFGVEIDSAKLLFELCGPPRR